MDLETENRIAAILMKEAAELRRQAEKEGVHAYLHQPKVRGRPNSRFLSATVLGVQQANRAAEVNEMWRVRQKELELDDKLKRRSRDGSSSSRSRRDLSDSPRSSTIGKTSKTAAASRTSSKKGIEECCTSEDGLRDEEVEEFLHSRVKRGRGAIGSRMDETGPYLPPLSSDSQGKLLVYPDDARVREDWEHTILGPEKPPSSKSHKSSSDVTSDHGSWKKEKRIESRKQHSKKRRSKEKSQDSKKEKKCKHRHKSR